MRCVPVSFNVSLRESTMAKQHDRIITGFAKMWPRAVFEMKQSGKHPPEAKSALQSSGVYVLYRDDMPYYVGKTGRPLWIRIWAHANRPADKYYNFWNYFSAFAVPDKNHLDEVEGVLIASMPTQNGAIRRIPRIPIPSAIARRIHDARALRPEV